MLHYIAPKDTVTPCGKTPQLSTVNPDLVECVTCIRALEKAGLIDAQAQYAKVFGPRNR